MIKVGVVGASGKMGSEVVKTVIENSDMELVCAIDKFGVGNNVYNDIYIEGNIKEALEIHKPEVVVDFTQPDTIFENAKLYLNMGIKPVIGTTGLKAQEIKELEELSKEKNVGCFIAPNFTIGAVLMMIFARTASKYFDNAEILEFHHNQKKDAPSGTAIKTAELMAQVKENFAQNNCAETETIKGSRGGCGNSNIQIHSIRMPGFMASQEILFGAPGQILKIRHDSVDRKCYMSGVSLGIRHVYKENNFTYGLENIL